jgi:methylenetetrahydrofolate--tRNA-(uracil-5-)-methyltransferase
MESAMSGLVAGIALADKLLGKTPLVLPPDTMTGALTAYISDESVEHFEPMGANMGILPALQTVIKDKQAKYQALADRAIQSLNETLTRRNG